LPNLANHPVPSDDEIWILSAAHKLATEGVFGTDLFADFYNADHAYLFNMPLHHIMLAGVFKVFGTSIVVGRLLGVIYGLLSIGLVYLVARQLSGVWAATLAVAFMLFLKLNIGFDTGLPIQEMARTMRYDLAPVPFMLGAMLLLFKPTRWRVVGAGVLLALATLMQFYGAFMLPVAALYLLLERIDLRERIKLIGVLAGVAMIVALPYGVYIVGNYHDFKGQTSTLERRIHLGEPEFYVRNLYHENDRFPFHFGSPSQAMHRLTGKLAIIFGLPIAAALAGWKGFREGDRKQRLLCIALVGLPLQFAVIDAQKLYFYWVVVTPFLCLGLAQLIVAGVDYVRENMRGSSLFTSPRPSSLHLPSLAVATVLAGFLFVVFAEGIHAQYQGLRVVNRETNYMSLRERLDAYVPPGAKIVGATALWWAMPDTDYRSYYMLFYSTNPRIAERQTTISGYLDSIGTEYIVLNRTSRYFLGRLIPRDQQDLDQYLLGSSEKIYDEPDLSYGWIEVWKVDRSKRPPPQNAAAP
jgi:4-amino-4-deoxy-L-arabinose transferase-like glycosyltransferase